MVWPSQPERLLDRVSNPAMERRKASQARSMELLWLEAKLCSSVQLGPVHLAYLAVQPSISLAGCSVRVCAAWAVAGSGCRWHSASGHPDAPSQARQSTEDSATQKGPKGSKRV